MFQAGLPEVNIVGWNLLTMVFTSLLYPILVYQQVRKTRPISTLPVIAREAHQGINLFLPGWRLLCGGLAVTGTQIYPAICVWGINGKSHQKDPPGSWRGSAANEALSLFFLSDDHLIGLVLPTQNDLRKIFWPKEKFF